jgi:hypothetical protein
MPQARPELAKTTLHCKAAENQLEISIAILGFMLQIVQILTN